MAKRAKLLLTGNFGGASQTVNQVLTDQGGRLKVAVPRRGFLKTVKHWKPDLIILGAVTANPGHVSLTRVLKDDARTRSIPILALVEARPSRAVWAQLVLADEVVRMPVYAQELAFRVRSLLRLRKLTYETRQTVRRIQAQARLDDLTGLATHRAFHERAAREMHRAHRYRRPLTVLMVDVDHFKHYNDHWGHPAGDRLLRSMGRLVAAQIRQVDFGARYGGDEFSIILPETSKAAAVTVADRLRAAIEKAPFPYRHSQPLGTVTVSIGVATYPEDASTEEKLLEAADRALYQAKAEGRNLVREFAAAASAAAEERGRAEP
ncbi:MAG: diguanylate cyclase [Candidatus Methylomirabilia bacterium]